MKDPKRLERYQRWFSVFNTIQGQSILFDLKKMTGQDSTSLVQSIVDGKIDPYYTIFKEGRRSIYIDILATLTEPPEIPEGVDEGSY
ncbi:MAG: hypothetical protein V1709_03625, partial [Planctomycetota bacterium]